MLNFVEDVVYVRWSFLLTSAADSRHRRSTTVINLDTYILAYSLNTMTMTSWQIDQFQLVFTLNPRFELKSQTRLNRLSRCICSQHQQLYMERQLNYFHTKFIANINKLSSVTTHE